MEYTKSLYNCTYYGDHNLIPTCKCGANKICLNCGNGEGAIPCACIKSFPHKLDWGTVHVDKSGNCIVVSNDITVAEYGGK